MTRRRPPATAGLLLVLALLLVACGGGNQPASLTWRNVDLDLPDGWYVFEETDDRLSISNVDLALYAEHGEIPAEDVVAMFFTFEPDTQPDDWRRLLDTREATVETDDRLVLTDEVPATRIVYAFESAGVPTREMVVLIPSRALVVLAQPVPRQGQQDAPEIFLDHVDVFLDVLTTARFGRPVLE